jgi:hypothetical protein
MRRRLKREYLIMISFAIGVLFTLFVNYSIDKYNNYLEQCDNQNGYTCNIFGK